jgi:hypothetical protein
MTNVQDVREILVQVRVSGGVKKDCGWNRAHNRQQPISGKLPVRYEDKNRFRWEMLYIFTKSRRHMHVHFPCFDNNQVWNFKRIILLLVSIKKTKRYYGIYSLLFSEQMAATAVKWIRRILCSCQSEQSMFKYGNKAYNLLNLLLVYL